MEQALMTDRELEAAFGTLADMKRDCCGRHTSSFWVCHVSPLTNEERKKELWQQQNSRSTPTPLVTMSRHSLNDDLCFHCASEKGVTAVKQW